jgi:hypothetical protein
VVHVQAPRQRVCVGHACCGCKACTHTHTHTHTLSLSHPAGLLGCAVLGRLHRLAHSLLDLQPRALVGRATHQCSMAVAASTSDSCDCVSAQHHSVRGAWLLHAPRAQRNTRTRPTHRSLTCCALSARVSLASVAAWLTSPDTLSAISDARAAVCFVCAYVSHQNIAVCQQVQACLGVAQRPRHAQGGGNNAQPL